MHRSPTAYPVRLRCFFLSCCIFVAVSSPGSLFHCSTSAYPRPAFSLSHLREVCSFPTFSTHLPKVRRSTAAPRAVCLLTFRRCAEAALPREPSVAAFPHPPYHSHLPKVSKFPTFSTHLPKVRRSRTTPRAVCSRISPPTVPFPPSEGEQVSHIFYTPSEGAQKKSSKFAATNH